jgi:lipopolysaccharide biosynthesis glycosyltransferase
MSINPITHVVINIGPDYLRQAAVLARDLAKYSKIEKLHILLVDCNADFEIALRTEIAEVPFELKVYFVTNQVQGLPNIKSMRGVPIVSFGRLIIPEILPLNITSILYIDTDVKIRKNLSDLLRMDFPQVIGGIKQKSVGLLNYEGSEINNYFNAGVLIMNLEKWRSRQVGQKIRDLLISRGPFEYMDQDILNIIFEDSWFEIDHEFNYFSEERLRLFPSYRDPAIVHFAGPFKPWHYPVASDFHREWRKAEIEYFGITNSRWTESFVGYNLLKIFKVVLPKGIILLLRRFLGKKLDRLFLR